MLIKISKLVFLVRRKSVESILLLARHSSHEPSIEHRVKMENLLKRRFFFDHSFAIYGGLNGLYDYGPMGCAMKSNLLDEWRRFFVLEEQMLQVDCATLTPLSVLSASGHLTRFVDLMVKDTKTGECFRADHLIEEHLRKILTVNVNKKLTDEQKLEIEDYLRRVDKMNADEMSQVIRKFGIRAPETDNELSEPVAFNLMFSTLIGPTGHIKGFLRPETAQGIFVNFKRLLEFNQGKLPFAAAQIGNSFRNEISPRSGLIRVREFTMAEIEHFVDPQDKSHRKFSQVEDVEVLLYSALKQASGQQPEKMKIGQAVKNKIINNETLGYFIARIHLFLTRCGISSDKLRFRQHMPNEMAHYASDCWDAECQTSYGWIECVGCADRSCFDLTQHAKHSGVRLVAEKKLAQPKMIDVVEAHLDKTSSKKLNKKETKQITAYLDQLTPEEIIRLEDRIKPLSQDDQIEIEIDADKKKKMVIKKSLLTIKRYQKPVSVEEFVPTVIEPSFGIGRIMYAVWEHTFKERDANRSYFSLPALIAPYKCSILPLNTNNDAFKPLINELSLLLTNAGISHKIDDNSGSIGRRYARTDEIAIPFGITIDFDSLNDGTVTLRERDSMQQIRVQLKEVVNLTSDLTNLKTTWSQVLEKYPPIQRSSNES